MSTSYNSTFLKILRFFSRAKIGVYGFIADTSRIRSRTSRVAFVDLFLFLSYPAGVFLSDLVPI
jgi:hypothetical protein